MQPIHVCVEKDFEDLMPDYLDSVRHSIQSMHQALGANNFEEVARIAHPIKGNAAMYGMPQLGEFAADLEEAAQNDEGPKASKSLQAMDEFLRNVVIRFE